MQIQGVFFDLYGTLLMYGDIAAAWSDWQGAFYKCLQEYGLSLSKDSFLVQCHDFFQKPEPPHDHQLTVLERRIKALGEELGVELGSTELQNTAGAIVNAWQRYISVDPKALPVLQALKSTKTLALISNFDHPPYIYALLSELGLSEFFDAIVISGEVGVKKPDPHIFQVALQQTDLQPHEVIYVGDSLEDVQGAYAAGLCPIRIQRERLDADSKIVDFYFNHQALPSVTENATVAEARTIAQLCELIDLLQ